MVRSRMPPEYQVPNSPDENRMDGSYLRTCLGIRTLPGEPPLPLPVAVRRAHYEMARSLSLLGAMGPTGMDATQLAVVVALAMRDPEMEMPKRNGEKKEPTPEPAEKPVLKAGAPVTVTVDGADRPGKFVRLGPGGRPSVLVDGKERLFRREDVRLSEAEETEAVNQEVGV